MDTFELTPTTELQAVNAMLSLISETPVASDEIDGVVDAQVARQLLNDESRAVQSAGWDWNTDDNYRLSPNVDGEIVVPINALSIDPSDQSLRYVQRGSKLWDKDSHTFVISKPVYVDVTWFFAFEELPETARRYIALAAGRKFENRMISDTSAHQINDRDVLVAKANMDEDEAERGDLNVVRNSSTVGKVVRLRSA